MTNLRIYHQYGTTPSTGYGGRWYYLSKALACQGYRCTLVQSCTHHLLRAEPSSKTEHFTNLEIKWLRLLQAKRSGAARVLNWFFFGIMSFVDIICARQRPNYVIYSTPSFIGYFGAAMGARLRGAKLILDVRDVWPDTLAELGSLKKRTLPYQILEKLNKICFKKSDLIVSNLPRLDKKLSKQGVKVKVCYVPSGFDKDERIVRKYNEQNSNRIGYFGGLNHANAIEDLLSAFTSAKNKINDIELHIYPVTNQSIPTNKKLTDPNIVFHKSLSKRQAMREMTSFPVLIAATNDLEIYEYGIGANKLAEYFTSGASIILAYSGDRAGLPSPNKAMHYATANDPISVASAMVLALESKEKGARADAEKMRMESLVVYDYNNIAEKLKIMLESL